MYTERDLSSQLKQRGFKFVSKTGLKISRALASRSEASEVERVDFPWPRELMAIMSQVQT